MSVFITAVINTLMRTHYNSPRYERPESTGVPNICLVNSCRKSRNPLRSLKKKATWDKENIILLPVDSGLSQVPSKIHGPSTYVIK